MRKNLLEAFLSGHQTRSHALLSTLADERATLDSVIARTLDEASVQTRDLSQAETSTLEAAKTRIGEIDAQIRTITDVMETRASAVDLDKYLRQNQVTLPGSAGSSLEVRERTVSGLGDFVDSEAFRAWGGVGRSDVASLDINVQQLRAPLTEGADPGKILLPNPPKIQVPQGVAETPVLDNIGRIPVSTNSIEMVVYGSRFGATGAAVVAEGQSKPEATVAASVVPVVVDTVAFWIQATRQLLQDAPAARSMIDGQLRRGLLTKVEDLVSTAVEAGTYTNVTGAAGQSLLEVARLGIAKVQTQGFRPNALFASPEAIAEFDLALMKGTLNGASLGAPVWGLNLVPVPGMTKHYIGDFRTGVQLIERTGTDIYITDSHADTFIKNVFTVLAETRVKPVVSQPNAIVELKLTPATT